MGWSLTAFQEELQSSFIRMPISVSQDLRIPHIRITSLMWLSEMCHLVIIRYLIQKYNKYNFRIHDYFLAKALDQVRPGGMVAVITTKGTLDKANPTIRKYLAERAELVGAVRLPEYCI